MPEEEDTLWRKHKKKKKETNTGRQKKKTSLIKAPICQKKKQHIFVVKKKERKKKHKLSRRERSRVMGICDKADRSGGLLQTDEGNLFVFLFPIRSVIWGDNFVNHLLTECVLMA